MEVKPFRQLYPPLPPPNNVDGSNIQSGMILINIVKRGKDVDFNR